LHDWNVDFAVWCSYKYLNGGPGAVGGVFVHEKYATNMEWPRLGGWGGNDEKTRFLMQKGFIPKPNATGWNNSFTQIFTTDGLKASLTLFEKPTIKALRNKSTILTNYLLSLIQQLPNIKCEIITPIKEEERGAQLSLFFNKNGSQVQAKMIEAGIIEDYREPGVVRISPTPLYNSFEDVYQLYKVLSTF